MTGFDIIYATLDEAFDRANRVNSMVVWLGRSNALRVSWALHLIAMGALGYATYAVAFANGPPSPLWLAATAAGFLGTIVLLWLEQKWAEDVNLAFFKTNVVVGFLVLATVLAARMASGGL